MRLYCKHSLVHRTSFIWFPANSRLSASGHPATSAVSALYLQFLSSNFPAAWERLNVMHVANFSLLLHWGGSNSALKPAALLSHMDVVPENGNWTQDAFGGDVVDG